MVGIAAPSHPGGLHELLDLRCQREHDAILAPGLERVLQVFPVKPDPETGIERATEEVRAAHFERFVATQATLKHLDDPVRIDTRLRAWDQGLGLRVDDDRNDHLIWPASPLGPRLPACTRRRSFPSLGGSGGRGPRVRAAHRIDCMPDDRQSAGDDSLVATAHGRVPQL